MQTHLYNFGRIDQTTIEGVTGPETGATGQQGKSSQGCGLRDVVSSLEWLPLCALALVFTNEEMPTPALVTLERVMHIGQASPETMLARNDGLFEVT